MANRTQTVNRSINKVDGITSFFINRLEGTLRKLDTRMGVLLAEAQANPALADVILAKQNVEDIMVQSGYFEVVDDMLNAGYQNVINESFEMYNQLFGKEFQFSDLSMQRINALKQLDSDTFQQLIDNTSEQLAREVINVNFGASTTKQAIDAVIKDTDVLANHVKTNVDTAISGVYRESNTMLAQDNGIDDFEYIGPLDKITREFCNVHIGQVKTIDEWNKLNDSPLRKGQPNPVSVFGGGWNCRHQLIGV